MKFPPTYTRTPQIEELLRELDVLKAAFSLIEVPPQKLIYLRRKSLLKSSLYSARIEGNPLHMKDIEDGTSISSTNKRKREVFNINKAITRLANNPPATLDSTWLLTVHQMAMDGPSPSAGAFRTEESAIFNQAGVAVYLTPAPARIRELLHQLLAYSNDSSDPAPIRAAVAHLWFEKIHPFDDGNGRVGRLLSFTILKAGRYDFGGIVPLEVYLESHRQEYYDELARDTQDVTSFVDFFLTALTSQAKTSLEELKLPIPEHHIELLPRRAEMLDVIRDHRMVSFDFLARRFRAVAPSTLHYDLKQLIKEGYIKKLGSTRGAVYTLSGKEMTV